MKNIMRNNDYRSAHFSQVSRIADFSAVTLQYGDLQMKVLRIIKCILLVLLVGFAILLNCGQGYLLKQDIVYSDRLMLIKIVLSWLIVPFMLVISYGSFMSRNLGDSRAVAAVFISNGIIIFVISIAFVVRLIHFVFIEERPLYDTDVPGMMLYYEPLNPYLYKIERRSIWTGSTLQGGEVIGISHAETDDIAAICVDIYDEPIITEVDWSNYFDGINGAAVIYDPIENCYQIYNRELALTQRSPCSTFKIISSLAALENGVIEPDNSTRTWSGDVL